MNTCPICLKRWSSRFFNNNPRNPFADLECEHCKIKLRHFAQTNTWFIIKSLLIDSQSIHQSIENYYKNSQLQLFEMIKGEPV